MLTFFLGMGVIAGLIGAMMAALIQYDEDQHHMLPVRMYVSRTLGTALVTLTFTVLLSLAIGVAMSLAFFNAPR